MYLSIWVLFVCMRGSGCFKQDFEYRPHCEAASKAVLKNKTYGEYPVLNYCQEVRK
jgi:hypothetical protein